MKKYSYFQSSSTLSHLEGRLDKNSYLSKTSLPNSSDAKVFLLFQKLKKIPKRTIHPNLYHWYILMKQFSIRTIEIWQTQTLGTDQDKFINEFVNIENTGNQKENQLSVSNQQFYLGSSNSKINVSLSTPKNTHKNSRIQDNNQNIKHNLIAGSLKLIPSQTSLTINFFKNDIISSPTFDIEYVMEMQLKQKSRRVHSLRQRLEQQKLELISLQEQQDSIRVVFRVQAEQCQRLKDRISQWQQISNLRFRKQKRFNMKNENKSEKNIPNNDLCITSTN